MSEKRETIHVRDHGESGLEARSTVNGHQWSLPPGYSLALLNRDPDVHMNAFGWVITMALCWQALVLVRTLLPNQSLSLSFETCALCLTLTYFFINMFKLMLISGMFLYEDMLQRDVICTQQSL